MPPSRHLDTTSTEHSNASAPVRRNLFSSHFSRQHSSGQSQSQPPQHLPTQSTSRSQTQSSTLPPNLPHSPPIVDLSTYYETHSNPFSPAPHQPPTTLFPSSGIIAVHPATGRPILPTLPTLPSHLRLSTSSDPDHDPDHDPDNADPDASDPDVADHEYPTHPPHPPSSSYWDDQERLDKERIEKSLVEMMYRQRKRNQSRGKQKQDLVPEQHHHRHAADELAEIGAMEREELMGLIMQSLRKNVAVLEEERWMFEGGGAGGGIEGEGGGLGGGDVVVANRYN